ncbi:MAG: NAD(P)/FAD-dependent oxidoreductase [Planctomycetota bacterium]
MEDWEVIVIGGGAAGLMAASRAAEQGRRTLLLEKKRRPGSKILISGGSRCNLTHALDVRGFVEAFGTQGPFLHSALAALGPEQLVDLFEAEGVVTKVESDGKIFPVSDRAEDILAALLAQLRRSGCVLAVDEPVQSIAPCPAGLGVVTSKRTLRAESVILTTGGQSYPGSGSTGDGYRWAAELGHAIVPLRPALVPITSHAPWVLGLQGITMPDVCVQVLEPSDDAARPICLAQQRGSLLFAHFGVTGPAVLDVSRAVSGHAKPRGLVLRCDLLPDRKADALKAEFQEECGGAGRRLALGIVARYVPLRLAETVAAQAGLDPGRRAAEVSRNERQQLVTWLKQFDIPISGTMGFNKAEITAGGVALDEIDSHRMESRLVPGLFFAGEILDVDGPIGGYNFQAAFSTGWLAGESA